MVVLGARVYLLNCPRAQRRWKSLLKTIAFPQLYAFVVVQLFPKDEGMVEDH